MRLCKISSNSIEQPRHDSFLVSGDSLGVSQKSSKCGQLESVVLGGRFSVDVWYEGAYPEEFAKKVFALFLRAAY